jgi:peptide/nickel transport system permease protein
VTAIAAEPTFAGPGAFRRLLSRPTAAIGLALVLIVVSVAVLAPVIAPFRPDASDFKAILSPPTAIHPLGTDELGRDILSRVIWGARASMQAGLLATLLAVIVAVPIGLLTGYYRGPIDTVVMRFTDALLAFPFLIIAIGLAAALGPSLLNATIAIGIVQIPKLIRITRGEVLGLREEPFVQAAVADGSSDPDIIFRQILPNVVSVLLVQATVILPFSILAEATLSFLGLGVQPPTPSWGVMLTAAQPYLARAPWFAIAPGLAILGTTLSFNLLGDGLRDVLDPRLVR